MPKLVEMKAREIPKDVRDAVLKVLDGNWPFILYARRPSGQWETSYHGVPGITEYEVIGVLQHGIHRLVVGADEEDHEEGAS